MALGWEWFRKKNQQIQKIIVKYRYFVMILIVLSLLGALIGTLINSKGEELGSFADWVSGLATSFALIFAYVEIKNSREQFEKERQLQLIIYTGWKVHYFLRKIKMFFMIES